MPELPEVETVRTGLLPVMIGRSIERIAPTDFPGVLGDFSLDHASALLVGRTFTGIKRRGKYLIFELDDDRGMIVHLRMTGVLTFENRSDPPARFQHLALELDQNHDLRYSDQRKFGRVTPVSHQEMAALDARLGPEPLTDQFSADVLYDAIHHRTAPIKSLLLEQRIIAGLGNIYVDEALFRAGIHPATSAGNLAIDRVSTLVQTIRDVLEAAIRHRGTSFSSFRDAYGDKGSNQDQLAVYGRSKHGLPCIVCGQPIERMVIGGRGTSFCPTCQFRIDPPVSSEAKNVSKQSDLAG